MDNDDGLNENIHREAFHDIVKDWADKLAVTTHFGQTRLLAQDEAAIDALFDQLKN